MQANTKSISASTMCAIQSNANSCMPSAPLACSGSPPRCCKHLPSNTQVRHVRTGSCTAELRLIGIPTEMCRRITGAVRDLPIYLIRGAKILGRNALTACHTHGRIAPGGYVSALRVGTYRAVCGHLTRTCGHVTFCREPVAGQCFVTCPRQESYMNAVRQLVPWISCG